MSAASVLEDRTVALAGNRGAFDLQVEPDGLAVLAFDVPGEKVNKYSTPVMHELDTLLDALAKRTDIQALLLVSRKTDIFIAGADINEIASATPEGVKDAVLRGQAV